MYTICTEWTHCRFLFFKRNMKLVTAGFVIFAAVETILKNIIGWKLSTFNFYILGNGNLQSILDWFSRLLKSVNPLLTHQWERVCLFYNGNTTDLTHGRTLRWGHWYSLLPIGWKVILCSLGFLEHSLFGQKPGLKVLRILNALTCFTLVFNVISVLVDLTTLAIVKVFNFCK